jgi:HlyD family secretion protein
MSAGAAGSSARRSIRRHLVAGGALVILLIGGIGGWASTTQISGAIITPGQLVVESDVKTVQHPTGGVVAEINVDDDDHVEAGELLVRLDETQDRAKLAIIDKSLDELTARQARLEAERDAADKVTFPNDLTSRSDDPSVAELINGEQRLFAIRLTAREGKKAQLREQIAQLEEEVRGLDAQEDAKRKEIDWANQELEGVRSLWQKKLVQFSRVTELERDVARLEGESGVLIASTAQTKSHISEIEMQILQVDQDLATEVATQLSDIRAKRSELGENRIAVNDELMRTDIRAPYSGRVHQLAVHTVGGVIKAGDPIMLIVPDNDSLIVEVHVRPQDIEQLSVGQTASLQFTSFNRRTTPELFGTLIRIAPDISTDQRTGASFYTARIGVKPDEFAKLGKDADLVPGMPVEAFIQTKERTVLSYFVRPLYDSMQKVFRES